MNARSTWRAMVAATIVVTGAACAIVPPSAPTPLPLPGGITPAPEPTTRPTTRAALAIDSFEWRLTRSVQASAAGRPLYLYVPAVTLRETGGTTAVALDAIFFIEPGGGYTVLTNAGCFWGAAGQIDAGGTWSSASIYPYCLELDSPTNLVGQEMRVSVTFRDALGGVGQVTGTTIVTADSTSGR